MHDAILPKNPMDELEQNKKEAEQRLNEEEQQNTVNETQQEVNQIAPAPPSPSPSHKKLIIGIVAAFVLIIVGVVGIYFVLQLDRKSADEFQVIEYPQNNLSKGADTVMTPEEKEELARTEEAIRLIAPILAKETAEWLLTTNDFENIPAELKSLENEAFEVGVRTTTLYIEPEDKDQFTTNIESRKVCIATTFIWGGDPYAVAGNSCDEESLKIGKQRKEEESQDYIRLNHAQILELALELYQGENNGRLTNDQTVLVEAGLISELLVDPLTGISYEIKITNDGKSYCVMALLARFKANMQSDDGNDPDLYEQGPGCKF